MFGVDQRRGCCLVPHRKKGLVVEECKARELVGIEGGFLENCSVVRWCEVVVGWLKVLCWCEGALAPSAVSLCPANEQFSLFLKVVECEFLVSFAFPAMVCHVRERCVTVVFCLMFPSSISSFDRSIMFWLFVVFLIFWFFFDFFD